MQFAWKHWIKIKFKMHLWRTILSDDREDDCDEEKQACDGFMIMTIMDDLELSCVCHWFMTAG